MVASESVALDGTGHQLARDVAPAKPSTDRHGGHAARPPMRCSDELEPVHVRVRLPGRARSVMDGISVYQARLNLGETLAQRLISTMPPSEIDVVIPIPESSRPSAMQLAQKIGSLTARASSRTGMSAAPSSCPARKFARKAFGRKLNAIGVEFKGRNVLLVDDSIVRGTTSKEIVQMAREAGARKVYMASAAPPVRFPNVYGIDMPTKDELIAHDRSVEEIRQFIGADALVYQDVDAMKRVVGALNPRIASFEASCFDGHYITGDVSDDDFAALEAQRRLQFDDEESSDRGRLALRGRGRESMSTDNKKLPRVDLPPDLRLDTLAVREGLPPSQWGENSGGPLPDQLLRAPRCRDGCGAIRRRRGGLRRQPLSNPTVTMMERRLAALEGTEACIGTSSGMAAILLLIMGTLEERRPRGVLAVGVRIDDQAVPGLCEVRRADFVRVAGACRRVAGSGAAQHEAAVR